MSERHSYASYLKIDDLLDCQQMQSGAHDELLFIVIHQVNELWFKLILHEMHGAMAALDRDDHALSAYKMLDRVAKIEATMVSTWDVLQTLTPDKYHDFRAIVGREGGSGFQSLQYRALEFLLGVKRRQRTFRAADGGHATVDVIDVHKNAAAEHRARLDTIWRGPGLYDAVRGHLARRFPERGIAPARDYAEAYERDPAVLEAWQVVYRAPEDHMDLYLLAEKLVDVEDYFRRWRFRHLTTVSRIIGFNPGTGGSAGVRYLQEVANEGMERPLFPELWEIRNWLFR
jgi:tryptophan 2,3-dioxygenase